MRPAARRCACPPPSPLLPPPPRALPVAKVGEDVRAPTLLLELEATPPQRARKGSPPLGDQLEVRG